MSARGLVARGVPALPKAFVYVVGLIILLSIIILALAAYAESLSGNYYYDSGVPGFLLFVVSPQLSSIEFYEGLILFPVDLDVVRLWRYACNRTLCAPTLLPHRCLSWPVPEYCLLDCGMGMGCSK